jgi:hypothetical protein
MNGISSIAVETEIIFRFRVLRRADAQPFFRRPSSPHFHTKGLAHAIGFSHSRIGKELPGKGEGILDQSPIG